MGISLNKQSIMYKVLAPSIITHIYTFMCPWLVVLSTQTTLETHLPFLLQCYRSGSSGNRVQTGQGYIGIQ